jgi:transketolase
LTIEELKKKAHWVWRETLKLHKREPGVRIASSLSCVEIFVSLYYGGVMKHGRTQDESRDRIFVSKGHGSICLYPILADCGYFHHSELERIGKPGSFLGTIPDVGIPGYESINGSLGLGLGVACGTAIALKQKGCDSKIFVVCGDGEMNEGAIWEAVMFAGHHKLDNIILIIDDNKMSMLGYQKDILGLDPIDKKLEPFGWETAHVDGHDIKQFIDVVSKARKNSSGLPNAVIAETVKGKGVEDLERDILCHVKTLTPEAVDKLLARRDI